MVDGRITAFQGVSNPHLDRDMTRKGDANFICGSGQGIKNLPLDAGMDFQEIIAVSAVLAHFSNSLFGGLYRSSVQGRAGGENPGPRDFSRCDALAQLQVIRISQHPADGGDSTGEVEVKRFFYAPLIGRGCRDMGMHLGQARDHIAVFTVDYVPVVFCSWYFRCNDLDLSGIHQDLLVLFQGALYHVYHMDVFDQGR